MLAFPKTGPNPPVCMHARMHAYIYMGGFVLGGCPTLETLYPEFYRSIFLWHK